jgi:hypothetical protein
MAKHTFTRLSLFNPGQSLVNLSIRVRENLSKVYAHAVLSCATLSGMDSYIHTQLTDPKVKRVDLYLCESNPDGERIFTVEAGDGSFSIMAPHVKRQQVRAFRNRIDHVTVWFTLYGVDKVQHNWMGVNKGDNQIVKLRRIKG